MAIMDDMISEPSNIVGVSSTGEHYITQMDAKLLFSCLTEMLLLPAFCTRAVTRQSWIIRGEKKIYIFWEAVVFVRYIFSSLQQHMQVPSSSIAEVNQTLLVLIISKQRLRKRQLLLRPSMEIFILVVGLNLTTSCSNLHLSPQAILNISEPRLRQ